MTPTSPQTLQEDLTLLLPPGAAQPGKEMSVWLWLAGLALAIAVGLAWWRWGRNRGKPEEIVRPEARALQELEDCRNLAEERGRRTAVTAISAVLRRYALARFGVDAPVLTSEEILQAQGEGRPRLEPARAFWAPFQAETDGIKYAGVEPDPARFEMIFNQAAEFVRSTSARAAAVPQKEDA
ncbi:MAG: DUF4381 family protein [Lacunisphaera sp.]